MISGETTPLLVGTKEAAVMLSISHRHLLNLIEAGEIRSLKAGRRRLVPVAALHEFIDAQVQSA